MRLSRTERWILSNQYRILEALYPDEAESLRESREALEHGYELDYKLACEHVYSDEDVMTEEECEEVVDILEMFSALKRAYQSLKDKSGIQDWSIKFAGFDGNNETKQMAYARYFCRSGGGRYTELDRGDDFNSHMPVLGRYREMFAKWKEMGEKREMTNEDIVRVTTTG